MQASADAFLAAMPFPRGRADRPLARERKILAPQDDIDDIARSVFADRNDVIECMPAVVAFDLPAARRGDFFTANGDPHPVGAVPVATAGAMTADYRLPH